LKIFMFPWKIGRGGKNNTSKFTIFAINFQIWRTKFGYFAGNFQIKKKIFFENFLAGTF
jgi:hypothetical protein